MIAPDILAILSTTALPSLVIASLVSSELSTFNIPAPWDVSLIVTTLAAGFETVNFECAFTAVKILSAVVSLLVSVLNSFVPAVPVVEVNVTVLSSDKVNFKVVPEAMFA